MAIAALLVIGQFAGCSAMSPAGSTGQAPAAPASTATAAVHDPRPRAHRRHHPAAGHPALAVSRTSSRVVQPQPPPGSCHARGSGEFSLPDPRCTPGAISPAVTQANIDSTICAHGYTRRVRPPESITEPEKRASLAAYGDAGPLHNYEYDHLVSLELGGAPNDPRNLWPEPGPSPNPKDELENRLREMVCDREISLATAQREVAGNWVATYRRLIR